MAQTIFDDIMTRINPKNSYEFIHAFIALIPNILKDLIPELPGKYQETIKKNTNSIIAAVKKRLDKIAVRLRGTTGSKAVVGEVEKAVKELKAEAAEGVEAAEE